MKQIKIIVLSIVFIAISNTLEAQDKWSVEFRPDINFPTEQFGDSKIQIGYGFELTGAYRFTKHLSAYAGWGQNTFNIEDSNFDLDETGYTFGIQVVYPFFTSEVLSYLFRAGVVYNHIEIEDLDGEITSDSGHGFGYQFEAGLNYDLGTNWDLRPTIRYRALSRSLDIENTTLNVDLNYLSFGLGLSKSF